LGQYFIENLIESNFGYNNIGSYFRFNSIGSNFSFNTIGANFGGNNIGSFARYNNIADGFRENNARSNFIGNNIGDNIYGNVFGNDLSYLIIPSKTSGNEFRNNIIHDGARPTLPEKLDFTDATHVFNNYNCEIYRRLDGTIRLKYMNNDDELTVVDYNS